MRNAHFERLKAKLRKSKERGRQARSSMIGRLATMSPNEIRKVNPLLIRQLGPSGLAELAHRTRILAGAQPAAASTKRPSLVKPSWSEIFRGTVAAAIALSKRARVLKALVLKIGIGTTGAIALTFLLHVGTVEIAQLLNPTDPASPCSSLDPLTIDCVYTTQSDRLMIADAAGLRSKGTRRAWMRL
jgi:hypothetical protein